VIDRSMRQYPRIVVHVVPGQPLELLRRTSQHRNPLS
jgi:hypothetical protein